MCDHVEGVSAPKKRPRSAAYWWSVVRLEAIAIVFLSCGFLLPTPASSAVKCSCPSVAADGEGNSSCSAAESNNRCTIDYNLFAERELRAAEFLNKSGTVTVQARPDQGIDVLSTLNGQEFVAQVALYLSIAAIDQLTSRPETINSDSVVQLINLVINEYQETLLQAFREPASPDASPEVLLSNDNIVISRGCLEIMRDGLWMMFKAYWSPARDIARCGGPDLVP
jgi:hypothetical protein